MRTTAGTNLKAAIAVLVATTALLGVVAMLPARWRVKAERTWLYGVYYVGYRVLSVQLSCPALAVSGIPLVLKHVV